MTTFYKVLISTDAKGETWALFLGEEESITRPEPEFVEGKRFDHKVQYFDTPKEAWAVVESINRNREVRA